MLSPRAIVQRARNISFVLFLHAEFYQILVSIDSDKIFLLKYYMNFDIIFFILLRFLKSNNKRQVSTKIVTFYLTSITNFDVGTE